MYVTNLERMVDFYTGVFDLTVTDRGQGKRFRNDLVFMSASADQHHQLVLASGRPMEATFSTIKDLRTIRDAALEQGASDMIALNHGNSLSIYFADPEGNTVEVYTDTQFYVAQPHGDPLDLEKSDEEILSETEAQCRDDPTFMPLAQWREQFLAQAPSNASGDA